MPDSLGVRDLAQTAERRQLTVMFCDLVGSTALSAELDPEDLQELLAAFQRACAEAIESLGGYVAKEMGDGVMAYFGYPRAREDAAERAIRAGLKAVESIRAIPHPDAEPLSARVGIATGLVVVGDLSGVGAGARAEVVGKTPNLAARLQAAAQPGRVVVSRLTHRLAEGVFEFASLGELMLKGLRNPEPAWEVVGTLPFRARRSRSGDTAERPMVNRVPEITRIIDAMRRSVAGEGQLVGVSAEAGMGKSRLVRAIEERLRREPILWLEGAGAQIFANTPFHAAGQMLRRSLGGPRLPADEALRRLTEALARTGLDVDRTLPLIAELIGVPTPDLQAPLTLGADERRRSLMACLEDWLLKSAEARPIMMVLEDMHWIDPSTLELVDRIIAGASSARICILYTARPEFQAPWPESANHHRIQLERLDLANTLAIITALAGANLSPVLARNIADRAGGVALFAEELARLLIQEDGEAGGQGEKKHGQERDIPGSLSGLLTARLDQLGDEKPLLRIAAVLGQEFPLRLLAAVSGVGRRRLTAALESLVRADILVSRISRTDRAYGFRHALIRDAAYGGLLKGEREDLHRRAAKTILARLPEVARSRPEILAQHWEAAGELDAAVQAWRAAGSRALERRGFQEAQVAYERALAILLALTDSPERDERELDLVTSLLGVLQITAGYSAPRTRAAAARARELAERDGNPTRRLGRIIAEWAALSSAGEFLEASQLADRVLSLAQADAGPANLGHAHTVQMTARYRIGDLIAAEGYFRAGEPYFAHEGFRRWPGAVAQTFGNAARVAWIMGDASEAERRTAHALTFARESGDAYNLAFAENMAAIISVWSARPSDADALARNALALSETHGFPQQAFISRIALGGAAAALGEARRGAQLIREGLEGMAKTGARVAMTVYLTWLAESHQAGGDMDQALVVIDEALQINPQERFFRPETLRIRGELRLQRQEPSLAERDFLEAIRSSKSMGAKLFHQRASASLQTLRRLQPA